MRTNVEHHFNTNGDLIKQSTAATNKNLNNYYSSNPYTTFDPKIAELSIEAPVYAPPKKGREFQYVPDKCNLVYWFIVLFGIGSLLPFSATITAIEFFNRHVIITNLITYHYSLKITNQSLFSHLQ